MAPIGRVPVTKWGEGLVPKLGSGPVAKFGGPVTKFGILSQKSLGSATSRGSCDKVGRFCDNAGVPATKLGIPATKSGGPVTKFGGSRDQVRGFL